MSEHFDTAQICRNGHVITSSHYHEPDHRAQFCSRCGEPSLTKCEACSTDIRGDYHVPDFGITSGHYVAPSYCHACGKPYPWTVKSLAGAKVLFEELDGLDAEERAVLKEALDDLVHETPRTKVATLRFKRLMKKVRRESYEAVKAVVTDLISETVKKTLFGP